MQDLTTDEGHLRFAHADCVKGFETIGQTTLLEIFLDDPELCSRDKHAKTLDDIGVRSCFDNQSVDQHGIRKGISGLDDNNLFACAHVCANRGTVPTF